MKKEQKKGLMRNKPASSVEIPEIYNGQVLLADLRLGAETEE